MSRAQPWTKGANIRSYAHLQQVDYVQTPIFMLVFGSGLIRPTNAALPKLIVLNLADNKFRLI